MILIGEVMEWLFNLILHVNNDIKVRNYKNNRYKKRFYLKIT